MFCKNCGKEIDDKAVICVHCGVATGEPVSGKSWVAAMLLCFFFGTLGVHRFYTGHIASGIAQLLLTVSCIGIIISAPWVLIDFIMLICGNFKNKDGSELAR